LEGSIAIAQQHADRAIAIVSHHQVWYSITVEVRYGHGVRVVSGRVVLHSLESAVTIASSTLTVL